ncbi:MAG: hypothetical protein WCB18_09785 [Thermoplasmata archaeon]
MSLGYRPATDTGEADLLLFVAGEPDPGGGSGLNVETSVVRRLAGAIIGVRWLGPRVDSQSTGDAQPPPLDDRPWHLPSQQIQCVNLVSEIAHSLAKRVALVDVNRPAGRAPLIDYWVGSDSVLPLLVRLDGTRLEGIEQFTPKALRRFISQPLRPHGSRDEPLRSA